MSTDEATKWTNISAGPRQVKDLQKAMGDLTWEGRTHTELSGVVGGQESSHTYANMVGPVRAEVTALDAEIKNKYEGKITRENVREITAAYVAALPKARESRPTEDSRRTPEQETERLAVAAERAAEEKARQDAEHAVLDQVMAKAPARALGLIFAEYQVDTSDVMTDYFGNRTERTVAIGWRFSKREDFGALRAAAASFPETAHLGSDEALAAWEEANGRRVYLTLEHRDNHSMGGGNYLSDHSGTNSGSGWVVRSTTFPARWVHLTQDAIPEQPAAPAATTGAGSGITVSPGTRPGFVEIRFPGKPAADVRQGLKDHGFRWAPSSGSWYGKDAAYAEALASAGA